jgi:hypothetical protein
MLQIIVWMGCAYLVLKGLLILQMSWTSSREKPGFAPILGSVCAIAGVVLAVVFFNMAEEQVAATRAIERSLSVY